MLGWIPYRKTRSDVLWTVFLHTKQPLAISGEPGSYCLPLFSRSRAAEEWILKMRLEQHYASRPLYPKLLLRLLSECKKSGYTQVALDPPASTSIPFPAATIDDFIEQARRKCAKGATSSER